MKTETKIYTRDESTCITTSIAFGERNITQERRVNATRLLVPKTFLFGTQPDNSYERGKRRRVEEALKREGASILFKNPAIVCAVPCKDALMLAVMDGHHRTRYSPETSKMPVEVYTPEQIVILLNNRGEVKVTPDKLVENIERCVAEALNSFKCLPDSRYPHLVPGARRIEDLCNIFQEI